MIYQVKYFHASTLLKSLPTYDYLYVQIIQKRSIYKAEKGYLSIQHINTPHYTEGSAEYRSVTGCFQHPEEEMRTTEHQRGNIAADKAGLDRLQ